MHHNRNRILPVAIGGSLAALMNFPTIGIQGQPYFFMDEGDGGGTGGSGNKGDTNEPTAAQLKADLDAARAERDSIKADRDALKTKQDEADAAKLSETERLKKEAADAKADADKAREAVKQNNLRLEIERGARKLNVVDEEAAYKMLDISQVTFDKDGKATNVDALLNQLVKDKPYLIKQESGASGGASNPPRNRNGRDNDTTPGLGRLKNAFANKN